MYFELTGECDVYSNDVDVDVNVDQFVKLLKGKTFETEEDKDAFIEKLEAEHNVVIDSFTFREVTTEEEDDEAWDDMLLSALAESEETGQPFDHIMGEILGGVRSGY